MKVAFYIAKRYAFSSNKSKAINVISFIASMGIVVSAMAMFIVLSVFSGLRIYTLSFANDLDPDLTVLSTVGKSFAVQDQQIEELEQSGYFDGVARIVEERLLLSYKDKQAVAIIKGVDQNYPVVSHFDKKIEYGQWLSLSTNHAVVGIGIPVQLSMSLYDSDNPLVVMSVKPGSRVIEDPSKAFIYKNLFPVGVYVSDHEDIDNKYVFIDIELARDLLSLPQEAVSQLELKLNKSISESTAIQFIEKTFDHKVKIKNRTQLNDGLYRMLNTENFVVYLIFVLVVIMALFTLVGALIMIILEKQPNMKTLHNIGLPIVAIQQIFLYQGLIISSVAGGIGLVLGAVFVLIQKHFPFIYIRADLAYPIEFDWINIFLVIGSIFVIGFIACFIASSRANKNYLLMK